MRVGDYIKLILRDGGRMAGTVVKIGDGHFVLDEDVVFGDWVWIENRNVIDLQILYT